MSGAITPSSTAAQITTQLMPPLERARKLLERAESAAQVLEARVRSDQTYNRAAEIARLAKAREDIAQLAREFQAEALVLTTKAEVRLAEEIDIAQATGLLNRHGGARGKFTSGKLASPCDTGLTPRDLHFARKFAEAEKSEPGFIERAVAEMLDEGVPTKTALKKRLPQPSNVSDPVPAPGSNRFEPEELQSPLDAMKEELADRLPPLDYSDPTVCAQELTTLFQMSASIADKFTAGKLADLAAEARDIHVDTAREVRDLLTAFLDAVDAKRAADRARVRATLTVHTNDSDIGEG